MDRKNWTLLPPEEDYEDLSPIYSDEPYLSLESEAEWLERASEHSTPAVRRAVAEQLRLMGAGRSK